MLNETHECGDCGKKFKKSELENGKLPDHDRVNIPSYQRRKKCGKSGQSALKIKDWSKKGKTDSFKKELVITGSFLFKLYNFQKLIL